MNQKLIILGCGGHARSVADIAVMNDSKVDISFYDVNAHENEQIFVGEGWYNVYPLNEETKFHNVNLFIAIGNNLERRTYVERYLENTDLKAISIISNNAYVSKSAEIEIGTFVGEKTHIGPEAFVGSYSILNTNAVIEHEVSIGSFCHISVNATVCGRCKIGNNVFIGAGAVVKDYINICDDVIVGAGAVVCKDIDEPGTYVGCPAKKIK